MNPTIENKSATLASKYTTLTLQGSCTLKSICSLLICLIISIGSNAQDSTITIRSSDTLINRSSDQPLNPLTKKQINKRVKIATAANIVVYSTSMIALYSTWYKDYPQSNFHVFNDFDEWQRMDKIGHAYSAYTIGKLSMELWRWTGIERKKRIWIGGLSGAFYQTVIEVLDGFSAEWGWSWGDFGANIVGSGMLIAQELAWDEQRIQFKFSTHLKNYSDPSLDQRSDEIFGNSTAERFLKDYNGQTYWLSTNIRSFFPKSKWPAWLQVSVGTGAEGMFGATENIGKDDNGNVYFNRTDIKRYRQWYLAPDIDLSKIKTSKKGIKFALTILNVIKFPMPALEYSNGSFKIKAIAF
jgi:Predicted periplasmic lipoprotein (DUF2279)